MSEDKTFYDEYSVNESETAASKDVSEHATLKIEEKKYGINKPQRIYLRGKLKHGEDS